MPDNFMEMKRAQEGSDTPARIRLLIVIFNFEMERREIPAFRGAIANKVGRENVLFHNHLGKESFLYGYPRIQYKVLRKNPAIVCINEGSEEMLKFFEKTNWNIHLNGKEIETEVKHISFDYAYCGVSDQMSRYRISNWFALNEANFSKFKDHTDGEEQVRFLERILIGNILSFAKGIEWDVKQEIRLSISDLPKGRLFNFKNHQMVGLDVEFVSNVVLPDWIGLGKSVSRGFGVLRKVGNRWNR